jgi:hypothetical protein
MSTIRTPSRLELLISSIGSYMSALGVLIFLYQHRPDAFMKKREGGRQPVGRGRDHAGMDAAVAAAVPSVRRAAAHPRAAIRPPLNSGRAAVAGPDRRPTSVALNAIQFALRSVERHMTLQ